MFPDCDAKVETFSETTKSFSDFFSFLRVFSLFSSFFAHKRAFFLWTFA
ncbi:hypothetical protein HMPREF9999_01086 [Alloprevotella sp. oral taxon 473 str. F0040]|nr:hypothetical protein HMPREF9999_01086 [Alloprevotella sp. oral taxon 473 str. F0040]